MKISVTTSDPCALTADCLIVGIHQDTPVTGVAAAVNRATKGLVKRLLDRNDMDGTAGRCVMLPLDTGVNAQRLLLVGLGKPGTARDFETAVRGAAETLGRSGSRNAVFALTSSGRRAAETAQQARLVAQGFSDAQYRFDQMKSHKDKRPATLARLTLAVAKGKQVASARQGVREGNAIAAGLKLARDLGNLPGNICTPTYLAQQARKLGRSHALKVSVLNENRMKTLKMGSLLSVSQGSRQPAKLIVMEYGGAKRGDAPIVLVGKGLTFDAGGISLKPAGGMEEMKFDMCGGASVFGTLLAIAELKLKVNVVGIVPSSENLPDGAANKPGDIVTSMAGKTIEIINTDAEGRLILCDALTYAERYQPAAVIDIATLTGACVVALGSPASGLFSNNDELADDLLSAGTESGDRAWRMPVWDDYQAQLKSPYADMANVGGRSAGAVTAACFLARFTETMKWAHLDIAGTAWAGGKNKGSTGRPVPLLTRYLINQAPTA